MDTTALLSTPGGALPLEFTPYVPNVAQVTLAYAIPAAGGEAPEAAPPVARVRLAIQPFQDYVLVMITEVAADASGSHRAMPGAIAVSEINESVAWLSETPPLLVAAPEPSPARHPDSGSPPQADSVAATPASKVVYNSSGECIGIAFSDDDDDGGGNDGAVAVRPPAKTGGSTGAASVDVEVLLGVRDHPLTMVLMSSVAHALQAHGERRPALLAVHVRGGSLDRWLTRSRDKVDFVRRVNRAVLCLHFGIPLQAAAVLSSS